MYGIIQGLYFVSLLDTITNVIKGGDTKRYVSFNSILENIASITFPILLGATIEVTSFTNVAYIITLVAILQIIISFKIEIPKQEEPSDKHQNKFNLLQFFSKLKQSKDGKKIKLFYRACYFHSIVSSFVGTLITIIVMMIFQTSFNLGIFKTIFAICSIITLYVFQKYYKGNKKIILFCTFICMISVCILLFQITRQTILLYNFIYSVFALILFNMLSIQRFNTINNSKLGQYTPEHNAITELCYGVGRFLSYSALLISSFFDSVLALKVILVAVSVCFVLYGIDIYKLEKESDSVLGK